MHYIVKVNLKTNIVDLVAGSWDSGSQTGNCRDAQLACLNFPAAMTMDAEGNLYVANQYGHFISKVDQNYNITIFAGTPNRAGNNNGAKESATFNEPMGLEFDDEGNLLVADFRNHCIRKIDMTTGKVSNWCGAQDKATSTDGTLSQATMPYLRTPLTDQWKVLYDTGGKLCFSQNLRFLSHFSNEKNIYIPASAHRPLRP